MAETPDVEPIRGTVAALLNERELVINRGSEHGVAVGMKFRVMTKDDVVVDDPETGEPLGSIMRIKVRVRADSVQDHMTICKTYETVGGSLLSRSIFDTGLAGGAPKPRTLRTGDQGFLPPIAEKESYVEVGDPVEEILE